MAAIGTSVPTLLDIAKSMGPDGTFDTDRVNLLKQSNEILDDMVWKAGNLPTGHRTTVITGLPTVYFRRINEGVPLSKSSAAQIDEAAAMLEGFFQVDRELALLSGNVNQYRYEESATFLESMNQTLASYIFYGNASSDPKQFTGLAPRYNSAASTQVVDGAGTGTDNTSIWLVGWGSGVFGIYPKNTTGGLQHEDVTVNKAALPGGPSGAYIGDVLADANGNQYMGYKDHFIWRCGLALRDYRAIVRIANLDVSDLITNVATGVNLLTLMIRAYYRIPTMIRKNSFGDGGISRAAWYVNPTVKSILHSQAMNKASNQITLREIEGREVVTFLGLPIREVEQILNTEARVV